MIKVTMIWQLIPAKQDTEDDFYVTLGLGGATIELRGMSHQHKDPIKSGTTPSLSNHWDTLEPDEAWDHERQDEVLFLTLLLGVVCAARKRSWAKSLRGTRDGLIWEGALGVWICVSVPLWFCYADPRRSLLPSTQYCSINWLQTCSISSLYHLYC